MNIPYVIITPAKNEGAHASRTIESVISQTLRPERWIIVDDGSSDNTGAVIANAAAQHPWIQVVRRSGQGMRRPGGGVVEAFNEGFRLADHLPWEFIVKLDCDLSFAPDYFERILSRFQSNQRLGIASGIYLEQQRKTEGWRPVIMPPYHAAGACKVVRRKCFEEIGGFVASRGWDTVDEIKAMSRGWETTHFTDLLMYHWKPEGSGVGWWRTNQMLGEIYYLTGGGKIFLFLKIGRRMLTPPLLLAGWGMAWGYFKTSLRGNKRLVSPDEARLYRRLLNARLAGRARSSLLAG